MEGGGGISQWMNIDTEHKRQKVDKNTYFTRLDIGTLNT